MSNPLHTSLCHCGSCEDAVDAAFRAMEQLLTHQCIHWFVAVTVLQARVAQGFVDGDPRAAALAARFDHFMGEHGDAMADRLSALLVKLDMIDAPDGSTLN